MARGSGILRGPWRSAFGFSVGASEASAVEVISPTGELNEGAVRIKDVTLTSAQVLALNATPVSVIAAPGANKAIIILGVATTKAAGTAYDGINVNEDITLKYTDGSGATLATIETTGFLDQATAQARYSYPSSWATNAATALLAITPVANAAVVAYMTTAEIATGNSPVKMRIYYRVIPTVL